MLGYKEKEDIGLDNTYVIAVRMDVSGCFGIVPISGDTLPRKYYRPQDIEKDYRYLLGKFGEDNVKIFREIEVVLME